MLSTIIKKPALVAYDAGGNTIVDPFSYKAAIRIALNFRQSKKNPEATNSNKNVASILAKLSDGEEPIPSVFFSSGQRTLGGHSEKLAARELVLKLIQSKKIPGNEDDDFFKKKPEDINVKDFLPYKKSLYNIEIILFTERAPCWDERFSNENYCQDLVEKIFNNPDKHSVFYAIPQGTPNEEQATLAIVLPSALDTLKGNVQLEPIIRHMKSQEYIDFSKNNPNKDWNAYALSEMQKTPEPLTKKAKKEESSLQSPQILPIASSSNSSVQPTEEKKEVLKFTSPGIVEKLSFLQQETEDLASYSTNMSKVPNDKIERTNRILPALTTQFQKTRKKFHGPEEFNQFKIDNPGTTMHEFNAFNNFKDALGNQDIFYADFQAQKNISSSDKKDDGVHHSPRPDK